MIADSQKLGLSAIRFCVDSRYTRKVDPVGVWRSGSAPALGAGGHRFESCHPDQLILAVFVIDVV